MSSESKKPTDNEINNGDANLVGLEEWKNRHLRALSPNDEPEFPHFCRMKEGVIKRLDKDDTLEEESLGSGLAAMVNLGEVLISIAADALKKIKTEITTRIKDCLK